MAHARTGAAKLAPVVNKRRMLAMTGEKQAKGADSPFPLMSLSLEKTTLPWLCCLIPGICLFCMIVILGFCLVCHRATFVFITCALSIYIAGWTTNMAIFSAVGACFMRRDTAKDWHAMYSKLKAEDPDSTDAMHFVIIPNYKEEEDMLQETLENLARSPMARSCIRVVLGMEEREGSDVREKANRLVASTSHMFADIFATFHPANLSGEVPGKSSNTQWAFHKVMQNYEEELKDTFDPTQVFLTVIDADSIMHPQYFSNLAYQGMTMSRDARAWRMWQPPVLLLRNFFSVPGPTRVSGLGTVLFELAGLANQYFGSHITFSSYSMTLALAAHTRVGGWDPDVIGEDHHMFAKCYFAPLWDAALREEDTSLIVPKVQLDPIFLPALCYMAESTDQTYWSSLRTRFQQARRHSQGVAELSYCFLQYIRLCMTVGFVNIPWITHRGIFGIIQKMFTVHVLNTVHAVSFCLSALIFVPNLMLCAWAGGFSTALASTGLTDFVWYVVAATLSALGPVGCIAGITTFIVVRDNLDGVYDQGQAGLILDNPARPRLSFWQTIALAIQNQWDFVSLAEPTVLLFGMVPELMAAWSLLWSGTTFEYLVAPKPANRKLPGVDATVRGMAASSLL